MRPGRRRTAARAPIERMGYGGVLRRMDPQEGQRGPALDVGAAGCFRRDFSGASRPGPSAGDASPALHRVRQAARSAQDGHPVETPGWCGSDRESAAPRLPTPTRARGLKRPPFHPRGHGKPRRTAYAAMRCPGGKALPEDVPRGALRRVKPPSRSLHDARARHGEIAFGEGFAKPLDARAPCGDAAVKPIEGELRSADDPARR